MTNEFLFLLTSVVVFLWIFYCFFLGKRWLHVSIALNLIIISIFGAKVIATFGQVTNVGNIFYAAVFFAGQILVEHYGRKEGIKSLWIGLASVLYIIVVGQVIVRYVPIPESLASSQAIGTLFNFAPRVALASVLAYISSQSLNMYLYSYLTNIYEKKIWLRSVVSSFFGQALDSAIFFSIAFLGILPPDIFLTTMLVGFILKFLVGLMAIPLLYLSYVFKGNKEVLEQEAETIIAGMGDGVIVTDKKGKIILVNRAFSEMLGFHAKEVIGKMMTDVVQREDENKKRINFEERILTQVLAGKKVATNMINHTYFVRKNGTRFPVVITVTPIFIDAKIMGAVEIFRDVTREKEIDKLRTDFLSLASHQLRTPLSGARWIVETLLQSNVERLDERQKKYLNNLYLVNNRMIQLVSDMLNILHIQGGVVKVRKEEFSLTKLYQEALTTVGSAAANRQIVIETGTGDMGQVVVYSDFKFIKSIVESLLSNAINYSRPGSKIVFTYTQNEDEVILSVVDSGIGIPEREQQRIFQRFYRASNAQKMNVNGTGLGLYISSMLAEKVGARVTFESKENKGSTFYVILPSEKS